MTDFLTESPLENPITLRRKGKTFYSPSLFHLAPTHNRIVPLAIRDVTSASNLLEIYGVSALEEHSKGYIIINNYPVSTVQIFGRILWYTYKNFDRGTQKNPFNFFLLQLDDCSGENLSICVKIFESKLLYSLASITENLLVEVTGTVSHIWDYEKQVIGTSLRILGQHDEIEVEMQCWRRILTTRKLLCHPWKCVPARPDVVDSDDLMELRPEDYERQLNPSSSPVKSLLASRVHVGKNLEIPSSPGSSLVYYTASDHLDPSTESPQEDPRLAFGTNPEPERNPPLRRAYGDIRAVHSDSPQENPKTRKYVRIPLLLRDSQNRPYHPIMHIVDSEDSDGGMSDPILSDSSHPTRNLLVIIID